MADIVPLPSGPAMGPAALTTMGATRAVVGAPHVAVGATKVAVDTARVTMDTAKAAVDLVRKIGLVGLVRPATTPAPVPAHLGPAHLGPARRDDAKRAVVRLRTVSGAATGLNAGSIAGGLDAPDRTLPVIPELRGLLPGHGLRRGSTVAVTGATSLLLGLLAAASMAGSWCAVVGMPALGLLAAAEAGIGLDRFVLVPHPGPDWSTVVAALLDGVDVVVAAPPGPVAAAMTGRLAARARQRGSVLIAYGRWPGADVVLDSTGSKWDGLDQGRGRLYRRELTVLARGRGAASHQRSAKFWMPAFAPINTGWSVGGWRDRNRSDRPGLTLVNTRPITSTDVLATVNDMPAVREVAS